MANAKRYTALIAVLLATLFLTGKTTSSFTGDSSGSSCPIEIIEGDCTDNGDDDDDDDDDKAGPPRTATGNAGPRLIPFSIRNNGNTPVCDMHVLPLVDDDFTDDDDDENGCEILACRVPPTWTCGVPNAQGGLDFVANTAADCIERHEVLSGFGITVRSGFVGPAPLSDDDDDDSNGCCFRIRFTGPGGVTICTKTVCFCALVGVEEGSWGDVKVLYHD